MKTMDQLTSEELDVVEHYFYLKGEGYVNIFDDFTIEEIMLLGRLKLFTFSDLVENGVAFTYTEDGYVKTIYKDGAVLVNVEEIE
jgi:hypothetical protein